MRTIQPMFALDNNMADSDDGLLQMLLGKVGVILDRNISNIASEQLQNVMSRFPDCTVIAGSYETFRDRYNEMKIALYRGSGSGFRDSKIFPNPFCHREFMVAGTKYLRLGLGSTFNFEKDIDEGIISAVVSYCMRNPSKGVSISSQQPLPSSTIQIMPGDPPRPNLKGHI